MNKTKPKETEAPVQIPVPVETQLLELKATAYELISEIERLKNLLGQIQNKINSLMRG